MSLHSKSRMPCYLDGTKRKGAAFILPASKAVRYFTDGKDTHHPSWSLPWKWDEKSREKGGSQSTAAFSIQYVLFKEEGGEDGGGFREIGRMGRTLVFVYKGNQEASE